MQRGTCQRGLTLEVTSVGDNHSGGFELVELWGGEAEGRERWVSLCYSSQLNEQSLVRGFSGVEGGVAGGSVTDG
jgi:hypothetical protein